MRQCTQKLIVVAVCSSYIPKIDILKFELFREPDLPSRWHLRLLSFDSTSGIQHAVGFSPTTLLQRTAEIAKEQVDMLTSYISTTLTGEQGVCWEIMEFNKYTYRIHLSNFEWIQWDHQIWQSVSFNWLDFFRHPPWSLCRSHESRPRCSVRVHWQEGLVFGLHVQHARWRSRWGKKYRVCLVCDKLQRLPNCEHVCTTFFLFGLAWTLVLPL